MSVLVMTRVWALDVPHHEQSVLLALADHADDQGGNVYPSIGYVAWKLSYSDRQVRRIVSDLRKRGVLVVTRPGRGKFPPHYRLDLTGLPLKAPYRDETDKMSSSSERSERNPDILSSLSGIESEGGTSATADPDIDDAEADISAPDPDIYDAHPDIAMSAKPSLVNRHLETSPESSEKSPRRAAAREAPPGGPLTIDDREATGRRCSACNRPAPPGRPWPDRFCSQRCARASPNGNSKHADLPDTASAELAVQPRGSP